MRSSWLASAMNRRIRSADSRAASSDCSRSWNADSIWLSMMFSDRPSRPISVSGSRSGTRRFRCPAAISPAVSSISTSGRRLARTTATAAMPRMHTMMNPMTSSAMASRPIVALMLKRSTPTTSVPCCCLPLESVN